MKAKLLIPVLFAVALSSCGPEEPNTPPTPQSKEKTFELQVTADALFGSWTAGDSLDIIDNIGNHCFKTSASGKTATFTGESYARAIYRTALYPRNPGTSVSGGVITVRAVPSEQRGFTPASVAVSGTTSFKMQPLCAVVELGVVSSDVVSVSLSDAAGGNLCGDVKVTTTGSNDSFSTEVVGKGRTVTLLPQEGSEFLPAGRLKVLVLPGEYTSGLAVTVLRLGGREVETVTAPVSVKMGEIVSVGQVEDGSLPDLAPEDIDIVMWNGTFLWPFTSPSMSSLSSSVGTASFPGQEKELVLPESLGGYVFKVKATTGLCRHSTQGFRFGGGIGDYIDFPVLKGLFLTKVTVVSGNGSTAMQIVRSDGTAILGGNLTASFSDAGQSFTWALYGTERSGAFRLSLVAASFVGIREIHLHYDVNPQERPTGPIRVLDYGLAEAKTGEERFKVLTRAHVDALALGLEVDYSGVGTIDLEIPSNATTINIGEHTDFKGTVFHVTNKGKKLYLFTCTSTRKKIEVTGAQIDNADYRSVPELRSGLYLLSVQDDSLWVKQREGHDYGATRKEVMLVRDGVGSNGPIAPYSTPATRINASYCETTDDQKSFGNVTLDRDIASTYMTHLVKIEGQNNFRLHDITVNTPVTDWYGDGCISITNCTNTLCEDITFNGTYSQTDHYGYGLACNNIWNSTFRRITSHCPWGVFGNNNTHDSLLEDSDVERFDTHCYGRNITVRNTTLTGRGIPVSSIFGTILLDHVKLVRCYPYSIRADYNSYVDLEVVMRDCEMSGTSAWIFPMGRLDARINERPELAEKRWPNVTIDGLTFEVPSSATELYLFRPSTKNTYKQPLGCLSNINIKGLTLKYPDGKATVPFYLSSQAATVQSGLNVTFDGCSFSSPSGASPATVYMNLHGPSDKVTVTSSDLTVVKQ